MRMEIRRALRPVAVLAALAAAGGGLVACGDDDDDDAAPSAGDVTQTETTAPEPTETEPAETPPGDGGTGGVSADEGREIFVSTGCGSCHQLAAADTDGGVGPDLDEALPGQSPDEIRTSIVDPGAEIEEGFPPVMPDNYEEQLSPEELDALVEYLATSAGG